MFFPAHAYFPFSTLASHINEDKRKTEGQKQIFDVVYEVDGCPVSHLFCSLSLLLVKSDAHSIEKED